MDNFFKVKKESDLNYLLKINDNKISIIVFTSNKYIDNKKNKQIIKYLNLNANKYFDSLFIYIDITDYKSNNEIFKINTIPLIIFIYNGEMICSITDIDIELINDMYNKCRETYLKNGPVQFLGLKNIKKDKNNI